MHVRVQVELTAPARETHLREMLSAAVRLTDDRESVRTSVVVDDPRAMLAEFTMPKARQMDVIDKIGHTFALFMEDYSTQLIWFPKPKRKAKSE